jgi:hypothetical protein
MSELRLKHLIVDREILKQVGAIGIDGLFIVQEALAERGYLPVDSMYLASHMAFQLTIAHPDFPVVKEGHMMPLARPRIRIVNGEIVGLSLEDKPYYDEAGQQLPDMLVELRDERQTVYLLMEKVSIRGGHGDPCMDFDTVTPIGDYYTGPLPPAFATEQAAKNWLASQNDSKWLRRKIVAVEVQS